MGTDGGLGKDFKCAARRRYVQNSGEAPELGFLKRERDTEGIVKKTNQCPGDETFVQRVERKDNRVGATVEKPVQWAIMHDVGLASEAVIDETDICAPGSSDTGTSFSTFLLNCQGLVLDSANVHAPVGRLAETDP